MVLEAEVAVKRLASPRNLAVRFAGGGGSNYYNPPDSEKGPVVEHIVRRNAGGDIKALTPTEATIVATLARSGQAKGTELAKEFGISSPGVTRIKNSGTNAVDEDAVARTLNKVEDIALDRLMTSLGFITDEKLSKSGAKDLSVIAGNMSKVHANLKGNANGTNGPQVVIQVFRPELRAEHNFKTIDV